MKLVYLASPYSDPKESVKNYRYHNINYIAAQLKLDNPDVAFILPITQSVTLQKAEPRLGTEFKALEKKYKKIY